MKERYINFFTDFGFKKLFGSEPNKDLLIDFLNEILKDYEQPIKTLNYKKTEHLGVTELDRKAIFDLYCENEKGEKFIVELQKAEQKFFKDRSVFYSTFPIQEQAQRGNWNYELKAVYTIGILDFVFDEDKAQEDKYLYHVKLTDQKTNKVFYDKLTFVYLEMPKFTKTEAQLETRVDKWLYAIKNLATLDSIPESLKGDIFEKFFELAQVGKLSKDDRVSYESSLKYYRDLHNVIDTAEEKGFVEGLAEGEAKGKAEGLAEGEAIGEEKGAKKKALQVAENFLDIADSETIAQKTGLTFEEVESLREKLKDQ